MAEKTIMEKMGKWRSELKGRKRRREKRKNREGRKA
jgi:hypothetical protein